MADVCQHARSATKRFSTGQHRTGPLGLRRHEALAAWQPSRRTRASPPSPEEPPAPAVPGPPVPPPPAAPQSAPAPYPADQPYTRDQPYTAAAPQLAPLAQTTATAAAPAPLGPLGAAFNALCQVPLKIWKGDLVGALSVASSAHERTRSPWLWSVFVFACNALLLAIITLTTSVKVTSGVASVTSSLTGGFGGDELGDTFRIPFWTAVGLFVVSLIAGFASLMLRALFIKLVFAVRRVPMTFFAAADLTAAGQAVITFPLAAAALLNFLPLVVTAWLTPVFFVVMGMLGLITIGTEYVGINKAATFTKSPLVPYAVLTTTCAVVGVLLAWLVTDMAQ